MYLWCRSDAFTIGLPPDWVDDSEEITANIHRARVKMAELLKAHGKALMPSFGDGREDQHTIEALTQEITDLLRKSEKRLQKFSVRGSSEDSNVMKNVQVWFKGSISVVTGYPRFVVYLFNVLMQLIFLIFFFIVFINRIV